MILPFLLDEMNKVLDKGQNVMRLWVGPKLIVIPLDPEAVKVGGHLNDLTEKLGDHEQQHRIKQGPGLLFLRAVVRTGAYC